MTSAGAATAAPASSMFQQFQDPPRTYSVRPFWFWNGKLDAAEIDHQIREMVSQRVYGAYAHNRTGLETPYLSDEYFGIVKSAYDSSRRNGFLFGFVDEYEWPGAEARDPWRPGLGSRVIEQNPDFRMRSLWFTSKDSIAAGTLEISSVKNLQFAVVGRLAGQGEVDQSTLTLIETTAGADRVEWSAPSAGWRLMAYYLEPSQGRDGGLVDLLNKDATGTWLKLVHDKYYTLGPEHFGTTIDSIFTDHEGDYGRRIAWTPRFFEEFKRMKGYDIRKFLPVLSFDGGTVTPKIRCDYLDVVSELYANNYMRQVAEWCERHNIRISGHAWEENLISEAFAVGDLQRINRAWSWPGADSLHDMGRSPRDLKVTASVAHFRDTRFVVENQGVQGGETYLDMQKMRLGTNMLGVWGVNLFVPHAFNYHKSRIEFPSDWFFHQPYWKYFHHYADYARRISFMNDGGRHHADILMFQPTETAWANAEPNYSPKPDWNQNLLPVINLYYGNLMNRMAQELRDFDIADSYFLDQAQVDGATLRIGKESFRVLVLPPLTAVRRSTMNKIEQFYKQGGTVVSVKMLPRDSMDEGRDDPGITQAVERIFGKPSGAPVTAHANTAGGKAFFIREEIDELFPILDSHLPRDIDLAGGDRKHWGASHRSKDGLEFYWLVNDSAKPRKQRFLLSVKGVPEKWDAATGQCEQLVSRPTPRGTEVDLEFAPWDAFYVVFGNPGTKLKAPEPAYVKLPDLPLNGKWRLTPEKQKLEAPHGLRFHGTWDGLGETAGFAEKEFDDGRWVDTWLSRERMTIRDWWLVGPFENVDHSGCYGSFPPESNSDVKARYGDLQWKRHSAPAMAVDLYSALGLAPGSNGTAYAMTYVRSPVARKVQFKVTANNNAHLWVNGKNLLDWHLHPWYYEMREDFSLSREAELNQGWNQVLLKVSRFRRGTFGFMVRITDQNGDNIDDLVVNGDRTLRPAGSTYLTIWYRAPVPATAIAVKLPRFRKPVQIFYNGVRMTPDAQGQIQFPSPSQGAGNVLALLLAADDELRSNPLFTLSTAETELGSWLDTGLPYFSGSASYETEIDIPTQYVGRRLTLDCGEVGVVAEVKVNGAPAGERVWLPFAFDISRLAKAGRNKVTITVTNTMENERAVVDRAARLPHLRHSGLIGPVRILAGPKLTGANATNWATR
ncbi:MAG TPA: glycosyl hydrolase [Bryobacteraceae bacterium]|nr:glycosyl hydrolase [Bryobacteraceae bacterium]